jgi:hypothetical protein
LRLKNLGGQVGAKVGLEYQQIDPTVLVLEPVKNRAENPSLDNAVRG